MVVAASQVLQAALNVEVCPQVHAAFAGATMLASIPNLEPDWIVDREYNHIGPGLVHLKCF